MYIHNDTETYMFTQYEYMQIYLQTMLTDYSARFVLPIIIRKKLCTNQNESSAASELAIWTA